MKKLYSTLLALLLSTISPALFAQTMSWEWADAAGDHGYESASSVATDAAGNSYITGSYTSAFIDFGTYSLLNSFSGTADVFVAKYDPTGVVLWAHTFGAADGDAGTGIKVDASGNVIITGWFTSPSITFGSTVLTNSGTSSSDYFVVKFDAAGNVLWAKSAGGTGNDRGMGIAVDNNGNIFTVGWYTSATIDFGIGPLTNSGSSSNEIFIVKYDPNGNVSWCKSDGGTNYDAAYACETDASGNLYVTGSFASASINFGTGAMTNTQTGFHDFFLVKFDANGNALWSRSSTGDYDDIGYAVAISGTNVYVTGYFSSPSVTFGSLAALSNPGAPTPDIFLVQYNTSGTANWDVRSGGIDDDQGKSVYADAAGNAYVTGSFMSTSIAFGTGTLTNVYAGTKDIFVAAFNNAGTSLWSMSVGNTGDEAGYGIACTPNADMIYVAGIFNSGALTFGANTIYKGCGDDVFIAKLGTATGIEQNNDRDENSVRTFPNPSNGIFQLSGEFVHPEVVIYDAMGKMVYSAKDVQRAIDISDQPDGIYMVNIISEGNVYSCRVIVE